MPVNSNHCALDLNTPTPWGFSFSITKTHWLSVEQSFISLMMTKHLFEYKRIWLTFLPFHTTVKSRFCLAGKFLFVIYKCLSYPHAELMPISIKLIKLWSQRSPITILWCNSLSSSLWKFLAFDTINHSNFLPLIFQTLHYSDFLFPNFCSCFLCWHPSFLSPWIMPFFL